MISALAFLFVLGFLIFIHEFGHFIAARKVGIRVEVFSLGFGPRLFGFKRGDTDYRLSAFPFGGYVRMAGEDLPIQGKADSSGDENADKEALPPEIVLKGDELQSKSIPQRLLVFIAGAGMNAVFAVLFTILLGYVGYYVPAYSVSPPEIGWISPGSPAEKAGLKPGDLIREVDGTSVETWEQAVNLIFADPARAHILDINRNDKTIRTAFTPGELSNENQLGGLAFPSTITVESVRKDYPAGAAGIQPGDVIVSVNGEKLRAIEQLQEIVNSYSGSPLEVSVLRNGKTERFQLTPKYDADAKRFLIGITFEKNQVLEKHDFPDAVKFGFVLNYQVGKSMLNLVGQLVTGKASVKSLGGPVMISVLAGKAAKRGWRELLSLTAFISLNLAILNVLPIPILDGGLILFLLIEALLGKPINEKLQIAIQNVFFVLLIGFFLVVTYNDIIRFFDF